VRLDFALSLILLCLAAPSARAWQRVPVVLEPESFVRSPFEQQYQTGRYVRGTLTTHISLGVRDQRLRFWGGEGGARDFDVDLARDVAVSFHVTAFTYVGARHMLLGGRSFDGRHGRLALVEFDVTGAWIEREPREWGGAGLRSVTALTMYPDDSRAVVLDTLGGGLYFWGVADGRLRRVLDAREHPLLRRTRALELNRDRERTRLTIDVLTEPRGCSPGRFDGPSLSVTDLGADGTIESVYCGPSCAGSVR
jgi:hypothetical protein